MFQIPVIEVPTNLPNIRKDLPIQAFAVGDNLLNINFIHVTSTDGLFIQLANMFWVMYG